ncbi:MAG: phosphopentomutase [Clostridia bacterium]
MRIILAVLDSLGIGNAPDAAIFGDEGSNTLRAISEHLNVPNLTKFGLFGINGVDCGQKVENPLCSYGRMIEKSVGKDTITGHFEMCGIVTKTPYPTYPNGFGQDIVEQLCKAWQVKGILGNKAASGTEIIQEYGKLHLETGFPIVYTSADSVLQVACANSLFPIEKLYAMCEQARCIMTGANNVARVIARPFAQDSDGKFFRTEDRKDFGIIPPKPNLLSKLIENNIEVCAIGKIFDIFAGQNITKYYPAHGNRQVMESLAKAVKENKGDCFIFANFVDFDMRYGHRNDIVGYANCLNKFDQNIDKITSQLEQDDILILTADHGCDPSTPSTDHSRECVPLLIFSKNAAKNLGDIVGFDFLHDYILRHFLHKN